SYEDRPRRGHPDRRTVGHGPRHRGPGTAGPARRRRGGRPGAPRRRRPALGSKKTPEVIARIQALMADDTAGDPMTGIKWTRRTTERIAIELAGCGIEVCPNTVAKLLKGLQFRLRVNHKKLSGRKAPDRDEQFTYIAAQ